MSEAAAPPAARPGLARRLWTYQAERFPVFKHGLLIAAFGASAVCLSALLRGGTPDPRAIVVAILVLFGLFLQLRIADEHKDLADDAAFRPERPVPRGLVTLAELRRAALATAALQAGLTLWLDWRLLALLALVWAWMALMTAEFFAPAWLKARPVLYMVSHMAVMPLIDLYATACDWLPAGVDGHGAFGPALGAFLALSFANGIVLEIARKSWAPEQEREGVETYSRLWGAKAAGGTVAAATAAGLALAVFVHDRTGAHAGFLAGLLAAGALAVGAAVAYAGRSTAPRSKRLEAAAGVFVLANYLLLGVGPMLAELSS
jgi:hypothetical protein